MRHARGHLVLGVAVLLLGAAAARPAGVEAAVTSRACVNCHTMHNSEGGQPVTQEWDASGQSMVLGAGPSPALTRYGGCVACHTNTAGAATIGEHGAPIVFNTTEPADPLAGGNFYWMAQGGSDGEILNAKKGHNVSTLRGGDPLTTPPGNDASWTGPLVCAGTSGCHGNPAEADEFAAIRGSHHSADAEIDGSTVAKSYRFLGVYGDGSSFRGVVGREDDDWEQTPSAADHNEYKGDPTLGTASKSISALCGRCHGDLHDPTNFGLYSPHFLHPTDVVLPSGGEYDAYTTYNPLVPVARQDPLNVANPQAVVTGSDCVMCLSCHRAHGTANWKLLRWDYRNDYSPPTGGCATCHTHKE